MMAPTSSVVSFTVRRPTPTSRPSSSGPESDGPFKIPALPRHVVSSGGSATGSPLAGSPRTFSSREDSDDDEETGIIFTNGSDADHSGHHTDLSDEDDFIDGSKQPGGQRFPGKKKNLPSPKAPLVIPAKPNPDWREAARRRRAACPRIQPHISRGAPSFVPDSALTTTGADGSVGGLGTRDTINSGPQLSGLQVSKRVKVEADPKEDGAAMVEAVSVQQTETGFIDETEDQRALRAILAGESEHTPIVDIIPVPPLSEVDALRQDVQELPDIATADDYERVPVSVFGAAMLRGMGWTDGTVASKSDKKRSGLTELYLPQARPALLGIGAKEREPEDDGSEKKKSKGQNMRYVPIAKRGGGRGEDGSSRSGTTSRRSSRSPSRTDYAVDQTRSAYEDRERRKDRDRDRDDESRRRTKDHDGRSREKDHRHRDRDRDVDRDRTRDRGNGDSYRNRGRDYDERDHTRGRDKRDR